MTPVVDELLDAVREACIDDRSGESKDPIPHLKTIDPDAFGICVATADGHLYESGDTRAPFPIQSISKTLTYGLALTDAGADAVAAKIDVEPSGDAFNEISLDPETGRPLNPMINAGAITAASLVAGATPEEQFARIQKAYSAFAGRELELSEEVLEAEVAAGHRNRAIGHMLREFGILEDDPNRTLDVYLRQCSLLTDCRDLAMMAATLANGGVQPRTGERLLAGEHVDRVLSVMTTCGMYDDAGDWVATVGLPAKSGVGGGIIGVLPGQVGIAVWSPRLDEHGSSVRGVAACRRLSNELGLHFLHVARDTRKVVRDSYDLTDGPSLRERPEAETRLLDEVGGRARVLELQGDLQFAGAEAVARGVEDLGDDVDLVVLDLGRCDEVPDVAVRTVLRLAERFAGSDRTLVVVDPEEALPVDDVPEDVRPRVFRHAAAAIDWCEERLLERHGAVLDAPIALEDHPLLRSVDAERLRPYLEPRAVDDAASLVAADDEPQGLFLVLGGAVALSAPHDADRTLRLAPGTIFGQVPLVTGRAHRAAVRADDQAELAVLTPRAFARMAEDDPPLHASLLVALLTAGYEGAERLLRHVARRTRPPEPA
ncbi:glutaminase A [Patulibacter americanus]|uniref:glutaminase A n=1 Tax=Patulibacter americanus TaxID=588672 RepID=UPI0003B74E88|nr:glutaminase A [Patulibacter americanus]